MVKARRLFILLAIISAGCQKKPAGGLVESTASESNHSLPVFELSRRVFSLSTGTNKLQIATMSSNDVIVAVNGYPLTKGFFDKAVLLKGNALKRDKNLTPYEISKMTEDFAIAYPRHFVAQRLLLDDAIRQGVVTTNDIERFVIDQLEKSAKAQNTTPEAIEKKFGEYAKYIKYEQSIQFAMKKLISEKIPPAIAVDDDFVDAAQKHVMDDNLAISATNASRRAELEIVRKSIKNGRRTFEEARVTLSSTKDDDRPDGTWGEFEKTDDEIKDFAEMLFAMPRGGVSDVVETDDEILLLKVVEIVPEKRGGGDIGTIAPERRIISRISVEKEPLFIVYEKDELRRELQNQMQIRAVNDHVNFLMTNGTNRVVYPNGTLLF